MKFEKKEKKHPQFAPREKRYLTEWQKKIEKKMPPIKKGKPEKEKK
jgi:hypothetical protein